MRIFSSDEGGDPARAAGTGHPRCAAGNPSVACRPAICRALAHI